MKDIHNRKHLDALWKENQELKQQNAILRDQIKSLEIERVHRQMKQHSIPVVGSAPECLL